jgi:hypothetical protein
MFNQQSKGNYIDKKIKLKTKELKVMLVWIGLEAHTIDYILKRRQ